MKRLGLAAACAFSIFFSPTSATFAQNNTPDADIPETLQHLDKLPQHPAAARSQGARYFIEFRSRSALSYGHTFVVFGRVGQKLKADNVAGLHPRGDSSITYMLGHIILVPSDTGASDGDLDEQYTTARYRIMLSAADYRRVVAQIRHLQAHSPAWNAATYNCNAFAGTIAHFVGLVSPSTWMLPEDFINTMRQMNDPGLNAMARHANVRR